MTSATRRPSITTFPSFSKFTVTLPSMFDWTWPSPQSDLVGWRTSIPGSSMAVISIDMLDYLEPRTPAPHRNGPPHG